MTKKELEKKVSDLQELKRMRDELEGEISAAEDEIKEYLKSENLDEVITGPFKITYKIINGTRFDSSNFKKDHPDLSEKYTVPKPYKSLRVY